MKAEMPDLPAEINTSKPHAARMYDYFIGGENNFAADREAAAEVLRNSPSVRVAARENRAFLGRAVRYLTGEVGIRQFLDIGAGLPTTSNVHHVAQAAAPSCRVVYADNDPLILAHAQALLTSGSEGRAAYIHADLRDPAAILSDPVTRAYWTSGSRSRWSSSPSCISSPMTTSPPRYSRPCSTGCRPAATSPPRTSRRNTTRPRQPRDSR